MVKDIQNKGARSEEFDCARLREIAEMALNNKIPNAKFSDLECNVWGMFREVLYKASKGELIG